MNYRSEDCIWESLCDSLVSDYRHMYEAHVTAHPEFYDAFESAVMNAVYAGAERLSARRIAQDIRWDHGAKFGDPVIAYYARKFISKNPNHRHLFRLRGVSPHRLDTICIGTVV